MRVLLHNHANSSPLHLDDLKSVVEYAAPAVGVCLDTGWALTSGDDPVACAERLGGRLGGLHLRNQHGEIPAEWLGEGDMDLKAFLEVLKKNNYAGWLTTELWHRNDVNVTRSLMEDQKRSVELLRELW
jgi:sugar phosphate isomerase/epimerase